MTPTNFKTMKAANPDPAARHWLDRVLIGLFALLLLVPFLDLAFHIDTTTPPSENRLLAAFPHRPHSVGDVKKFMSGWEAYFNDHFGCRRCLVMWHNKMMWSLMFEDKNARSVLVGTSGWFYISEPWMIEHFRGAMQFTEAQLHDWQVFLEHRRDWLAQRGIKYVFVIAPEKHTIYSEYLPTWLKDLGGRTKVDQFYAYMKAHSTVEVVDLRPTLLAAKKTAPVYLKTDTHWNELGSFLACEEMVRDLRERQLPEVAPVSLDSFVCTNQLVPGGDLVNIRGIRISMAESNAFFLTPKPELPVLKLVIPPPGEHVKDMATAKNPRGHGLAMVYTDSYGRFWIPFLGYQFGEVDFYWQYNLDGPLIERQKPVVVINEMVERFFNVFTPKDLSAKEVLP